MKDDFGVWLKQALSDLRSAEKSFQVGIYDWAAFQSQQAVEKSLKFLILRRKKKLIKIHNLVTLAKELSVPPEILEACAVITPVYFEVRYPEGDEMTKDKINKREADDIINKAKGVIKWVKKNC